MSNFVANPPIAIEGYTAEQVAYTVKELKIGAAPDTIQTLLCRKFYLKEHEAYDLIAKAQKATGIEPVEHLSGTEGELVMHLMNQGMDKETAKNKAQQAIATANSENSSAGVGSFLLGLLIFCVGMFITFSANSNTIAYGAIIYGAFKAISGLMQMTQRVD